MRNIFIIILFLSTSFKTNAQETYTPSPENLKARKWIFSARFGMFIHWGAYSVLGDGEWVMNNRNIRVDEYKRLLYIFNPVAFDAKKWENTAKNADMQERSIIIRQHDGSSNSGTKY